MNFKFSVMNRGKRSMNSDPKLGLCCVSRASACLLFLSVRFARSVANLAYFDETNCLICV